MTSRQSRFVFAVLVLSAAVLLTSAQSAHGQCSSPITITLSNTGGNCTQKVSNPSDAVGNFILVYASSGQCVKWQTSSPTNLDIQFASGTSPFYRFSTTDGKNKPVTSPPATGGVGAIHRYSTVVIGDPKTATSYCTNVSSLGLIMR